MSNHYLGYLTTDMLIKRMEKFDLKPMYVMHSKDYDDRGTRGLSIEIKAEYETPSGRYRSDAENEDVANAFVSEFPDAEALKDPQSYGRPEVVLRGVTSLGVAWQISVGSSACEQVQVGTRRVERVDPALYASLPKVTIEEPVYEWMCQGASELEGAGL